MSRRVFLSLLTGFCVCALPLLVRADKPVWAGNGGNGSGNASNSNNWTSSSGIVPGSSSTAKIDKGSVVLDIPTLGAIELTTGLDITGNTTTGTISGSTSVTFVGGTGLTSMWDAGEMSFTHGGGATFGTNAQLTIGTSNSHKLSGGSLTNKGNTSWTGGSIDTSNSATIANDQGATFTTTFDGILTNTGTAAFTNNGTFRKSGGGTGGKTEIQAAFNNGSTGTIDAASGTLLLSGGGTSSGNVSVASGATLQVQSKDYTFSGGTLSGAGTIEVGTGSATSFSGTSGNATLKVNGGTAKFNGANSAAGALTISSGTVEGSASITTTVGGLAWTSGEITAANIVATGASSIGAAGTSGRRLANGAKLTLGGATSWDGGGIVTSNASQITNTGSFAAAGNGTISHDGVSARSTFTNNGTFTKSGVSTDTTEIQASFENAGTISAAAGTLKLTGGGNSTGTISVGSGATLQVATNNYTFTSGALNGSGTIDIAGATATFGNTTGSANLKLSGGNVQIDNAHTTSGKLTLGSGNIGGSGNATVGSFDWAGGAVGAKVKSTGVTTISGANVKTLTSELTLAGNFTIWDGNSIATSGSAKIINESGNTFSATADGAITGGSNIVFTNTGTFEKTAGSTGNTDIQTRFESTGQIKATAGTLKFSGGGVSSNTVTLGSGAKIQIGGGDFAFSGASISGASGKVELTSNTTTFNGTTTADAELALTGSGATAKFDGTHTGAKLSLTTGNVSGNGNATFSSLDWSGGTLGAKLGTTGATTISGGTAKTLSGELTLGGNTTWDGNTTITGSGSAKIVNQSGKTFSATADGLLTSGGSVVFTNNGTFTKTGGTTGNSTQIQARFENNGLLNVATGKLELAGGGKNAAGASITVGDAASLDISGGLELAATSTLNGNGNGRLAGGTLSANGTVAIKTFTFDGGALGGTHTFTGTVEWNAGDWSSGLSATSTIAGNATLNIRNGSSHDYNYRSILNQGTVNWHAGTLHGGNGSDFTNDATGIFYDLNANDKTLASAGSFNGSSSFTNKGEYRKTGSGKTTIDVPFTNNGSVKVSAGTLVFSGDFTNNGHLNVTNNATAQFARSLSFGTTSTLTGTGTIVAPTVTVAGPLSPGMSPGTLNITGNLNLESTSKLVVELGGPVAGVSYDLLSVSGALSVGGSLQLTFLNGYQSSVQSTDTFTIVTAGTGLTGAFSNVASGQRLFTTDGSGSFLVNYGGGSLFTANNVVLSNFVAVPEPSTWTLLITGAALVAFQLRRRRR